MTINWIDCGLPYSDQGDPVLPENPNLDGRIKAKFGFTETEVSSDPLWERLLELIFQVGLKLGFEVGESDPRYMALVDAAINEDPEADRLRALYKRERVLHEIESWCWQQDELKVYDKECTRLEAEWESAHSTFTDKGLVHAGTLIEMENGKRYLIGDINRNRGVCDDCSAFGPDAIVKRYAVIWSSDNE